MTKDSNHDLSLKLRFRKILFAQGYWCPIEVDLSFYENLGTAMKRRSITDLDVLGIKFDNLFTPFRVVGDCKSGKNISDVNRLFWLRGIKNYFGADQAFYLHPRINAHTKGIAPKIGVRVLDEEALCALENNLQINKLLLPLEDISLHESIAELWGIKLQKGKTPDKRELEFKEVYSYLSYSYWYIEQHRNLFSVIEKFSKIAPFIDINNAQHLLLLYTGLERFVHSLLEISAYISSLGATNIYRDARNYIFGGPLSLKEKEHFFKLLNDLTSSSEELEPVYFQNIVELLARMIKNPAGASDILRHIQAIYLWCVKLEHSDMIPIGYPSENTASIVIAREAAHVFTSSTGINEAIFRKILSL